jgi:hypothetical protein
MVLHAGQAGWVGTDVEELTLHVSATSANATPMPACTDTPLASYAMAAWAVEP